MKPLLVTVLLVQLAACSNSDYPELEVKRLVARCVQEPAAVLQEHYSKPQIIRSVLDKAPIEQILETARRNRARDLDQLSPQHRALVETRMKEIAYWIDANTTVTAKRPDGPFAASGGSTITLDLPSSKKFNAKAKSLCIEAFREW